jgi:tetratricopeptide (TPR) repeat protein
LEVEAALAAELPRTAIFSLEILLNQSPRDRKFREHLADACLMAGDVPRAEGVLQELEREFPNDPYLKQKLKDMSARKTLEQAGYERVEEGVTTFRDFLKDKEETQHLADESREVKAEDQTMRLIAQYEARSRNEPKNMKIRRQLAELYTQKNRFEEALAAYREIQNSDVGNDPSLDLAVAETIIRRFNHEIEQLDPAAPDYAEQRAKIEKERQEFQIIETKQRADRFPTDLAIRFELGELYFAAGRIDEAIGELQKARNNPNRRIPAMKLLGQCYAAKNIHDLAAQTLRNAIREKPVIDDEWKELRYVLGGVLEKLGKPAEAFEEFKQIYAEDIGYKDVAARVDAYRSAQGQ